MPVTFHLAFLLFLVTVALACSKLERENFRCFAHKTSPFYCSTFVIIFLQRYELYVRPTL